MRHLLLTICSVALLIATSCSNESPLVVSLVESDVESVETNEVTLTATINASNFGAIDQVGFMVARSGSENFDWHSAEMGRMISLTIGELTPSTPYVYKVFVRGEGKSWIFNGGDFKTLSINTPTPEPEPKPEPKPEPEPEPEPEPTPTNGNTYRSCWYELPIEVDADKNGRDDNDNTLYYAHHLCAGGEKNAQRNGSARNYTVCFSSEHHCPVWVAAPRHKSYESGASRTDAYGVDPQIPANIQYKSKSTGGGCNKGHMLGSAERLSTSATNKQVFYYTNIAPQYSDSFNTGGGAWNNLEDHVDDLVCSDTLYVVIGAYFDTYTDKYGNTGRPAKIEFGGRSDVSRPTMFYYALLRTKTGNTGKAVKDCSASELQCGAFVICHEQDKGHKPAAGDMMTIEELEKLTGFTYFSNVPNAPKSTLNTNDWL